VQDRIAAAKAKALQAVRYRLAMLDRRLRQQGVDRALGVLHRRVGRGLQRVDEREYRLRERLRSIFDARERAGRALEMRLRRFDMRPRLAAGRRRLETARSLSVESIRRRLARRRSAFEQLNTRLDALSPLKVLERGYAIVSNQSGIVKDAAAAPPASRIHVRLAKGDLDAVVGD
jgi:exodeoxyribonuclease VII large subunit